MKLEYYLVLRNLLLSLELFNLVDYDLKQYRQVGEDHVLTTPGAYIGFQTINWETLLQSVQRADMQLSITIVTETTYGDERDILDKDNINHLELERKVFQALMNNRFHLSDVPGYESLADTVNDAVLLESIIRQSTQTHEQIDNLIVTRIPFVSVAYDYTAMPQLQSILAELEVNGELHHSISELYADT